MIYLFTVNMQRYMNKNRTEAGMITQGFDPVKTLSSLREKNNK
jgi:hypothetical protein